MSFKGFSVFNKVYLIAGALLLALLTLFYIKTLQSKLELRQSELSTAQNANKSLNASLEALQKSHEASLKALDELHSKLESLQTRTQEVKGYVFKSRENNLTKLFNDTVDRLWRE